MKSGIYCITCTANGKVYIGSAQTRMSRGGFAHSEETKTKLRVFASTPEEREKRRARNLGSTHSPETREKLRAAHLGRTASAETREKMSAAQRGKTLSDEHKAKLSEIARAQGRRPPGRS